jgi:choline dehydrogenase-like flavoprotein
LNDPYTDPRVTLELGANVQTVETAGNLATGVTYIQEGVAKTASANLIVMAANAMFNPFILLRSGFQHPFLGKRLHEQVSAVVKFNLNGVDNYQGSTSVTGHGYMLYDGPHRSERAACLIESYNVLHHSEIRLEQGRWRQRMLLKCIFEDLPSEHNYIKVNDADPSLPEMIYTTHSEYTQRTIDALPGLLAEVLHPLPIEYMQTPDLAATECHIQGTTVMGDDPAQSIVDRYMAHHQVRNLLVLGSSVFPSCSPANPTLTLSALSLWAVDHL